MIGQQTVSRGPRTARLVCHGVDKIAVHILTREHDAQGRPLYRCENCGRRRPLARQSYDAWERTGGKSNAPV